MDFLTNHMSRDIYKAGCQYFFIKIIRDNYRIYNFIILYINSTGVSICLSVFYLSLYLLS
jgi:hypothetical protein